MKQIDRARLVIETLTSENILDVSSKSESILIFIDNGVAFDAAQELLQKTTLYSEIKYVLTGGKFSEEVHDLIDGKLLIDEDYDLSVSTAWSKEPFLEVLWEFFNIYAGDMSVNSLHLITLSETNADRLEVLGKILYSLKEM